MNPNNQNMNVIYMVGHYESENNKEFIVDSKHSSIESATIAWKQACLENPDILIEIREQSIIE